MIAFDGYFSSYLIKKLRFFIFFVLIFDEIVLNESYKKSKVSKEFNYYSLNNLDKKSENHYKKLIDLKKNLDENYYEEDLLKIKKNLDKFHKRNDDFEDNEENIKVYKDEGVKKDYEQEEIDKLRKDELNQLKEKNEEEISNEEYNNELSNSLENEKIINNLMNEQNKVDEFNSKEKKTKHDHSDQNFYDFNKYNTKDSDLETFDSSQKSIEYKKNKKKDEYDKLIIELLKKRYLKNQKQSDVFENKKINYKKNLDEEDIFKINPEKIKFLILEKKINNLIYLLEEQRNLNELSLKKKLNNDKSIEKNKEVSSNQKYPSSSNRLRFLKNFDNQAKSAINYLFENNLINTPYLGQQKYPIFKLIKPEEQIINNYSRKLDFFKNNLFNKINNPTNLYSNLFDTGHITPSLHNQALQKLQPNRFFWHPLNQLSPSIPLRLHPTNKDKSSKFLRFPNIVGAHFTGYRQF